MAVALRDHQSFREYDVETQSLVATVFVFACRALGIAPEGDGVSAQDATTRVLIGNRIIQQVDCGERDAETLLRYALGAGSST